MVGDILTFYQERIANEGFLRTAIERRSILELGRLVGYRLGPACRRACISRTPSDDTGEDDPSRPAKAQSIPGADEQPQTFETSEDIEARGEWNALGRGSAKPQDDHASRTC